MNHVWDSLAHSLRSHIYYSMSCLLMEGLHAMTVNTTATADLKTPRYHLMIYNSKNICQQAAAYLRNKIEGYPLSTTLTM